MGRALHEIKDNYDKYSVLCFTSKLSTEDPALFTRDKTSRADTLYHESQLIHTVLSEDILLMAEQKKLNNCSYKFQIRCKEFCPQPLFRFDSDGAAHKNEDLPLAQQQVTTPHFNYFNEQGKSMAYKTPELEIIDYNDLKDMGKFFKLFCKQCYIINNDGVQPEINPGDVRVLEFDLHNDDLLSDVNFAL